MTTGYIFGFPDAVFVTDTLVSGRPIIQSSISVSTITADSTVWTADTTCVTADGKIVCIAADLAEAANAVDGFDAIAVAGGAVIPADVAEATEALDIADAVGIVATDAIEPASASDELDAVTDVAADAIEAAGAVDELDAAVGAQVLFGTVDEPAAAVDQLDADVDAEAGGIVGGGAGYPRQLQPLPIYGVGYGVGYGVLPQLWGEAHGVVGVAGKSAAQVLVHADAVGASGQAGNAAAVIRALSVSGHGAVGTRGMGEGMIVTFSGAAAGRHDDDEAAVIAFLLAA